MCAEYGKNFSIPLITSNNTSISKTGQKAILFLKKGIFGGLPLFLYACRSSDWNF